MENKSKKEIIGIVKDLEEIKLRSKNLIKELNKAIRIGKKSISSF